MTTQNETTRRDAFARLQKNPQEPVATIPLAKRTTRDRSWELGHPGVGYFIPAHLHLQAKDIRATILALSQKHMTTTSSVAKAFVDYALARIRSGAAKIEARPDAGRRKMTLIWEETSGWPEEVHVPVAKKKNQKPKDVYLNYRWGKDVDVQIKAHAGDAIPAGEVVVFLLNYALDMHKQGRLRLKEAPIVVSQKVSATW